MHTLNFVFTIDLGWNLIFKNCTLLCMHWHFFLGAFLSPYYLQFSMKLILYLSAVFSSSPTAPLNHFGWITYNSPEIKKCEGLVDKFYFILKSNYRHELCTEYLYASEACIVAWYEWLSRLIHVVNYWRKIDHCYFQFWEATVVPSRIFANDSCFLLSL